MTIRKARRWIVLLSGISAVILGRQNTNANHAYIHPIAFLGIKESSIQKRSLLPFVQTVLRPVGKVRVPARIKDVDPDYPKTAIESQTTGVVILAADIDESGNVSKVILMRSSPVFAESAIAAVRQWQFEPILVDGKPIPVTVDITIYFDLKEESIGGFGSVAFSPEEEEELSKLPPIRLGFGPPHPKLLKYVPMRYPEKARRAGIQGTVLLELEIDLQGRVKNIIVAKSVPELDDGAIQAARQLIYEPLIYDGKPRRFIFIQTSTFKQVR